MNGISKTDPGSGSTSNDYSNAVEMFIAKELRKSLNQYPTGVHIDVLASALASYGVSLDQLKYCKMMVWYVERH